MNSTSATTGLKLRALIITVALGAAVSLGSGAILAGMAGWRTELTAEQLSSLDRISADSLRGHLSFIASDALAGRDTPSAGLDIAAEYIAAQFRRAGLEPAGDDGYFQTAAWQVRIPTDAAFVLRLTSPQGVTDLAPGRFSMREGRRLEFNDLPVVKVPFGDRATTEAPSLEGKAAFIELPGLPADRDQARQVAMKRSQFNSRIDALHPALVLVLDRTVRAETGFFGRSFLRNPEAAVRTPQGPVTVTVSDPAAVAIFDALPAGPTESRLTLHVAEPVDKSIPLRNVVGVLRGSDEALRDSYVVLSAHYDHVGVRPNAEGDKIWNGANDDGSGTVSVIEVASALSALSKRPRRSIVFMTFFGEEKGLLGSRYYAKHPVFPLEKTVALINLEQVGRTDSTEGNETRRASLTGFDYTDVGEILARAGKAEGITVYKHDRNSDAYFGASDNQAFADQGVPAHALCVAFDYADYHGAGDHWEKIDYPNMMRTDRMVARGVLMLAESDDVPRWSPSNPKVERYLKAWKTLHLQP